MALLEAHRLVYGEAVKDRPAASIIAGFHVGNEVASAETGGGMGVVVWGAQEPDRADGLLKNTKAESGTALSIEGRAKTLREKAAKWRKDPERQIWLHCMATAFAYALKPQMPVHRAKLGAFMTALRIGEQQVATEYIFPAIELLHSPGNAAPDFSGIFPPTPDQSE